MYLVLCDVSCTVLLVMCMWGGKIENLFATGISGTKWVVFLRTTSDRLDWRGGFNIIYLSSDRGLYLMMLPQKQWYNCHDHVGRRLTAS